MSQRSGVILIGLFFILFSSTCTGYNIYTYTSQAVEIKEKTHALHYKSEFYDFIQRTFRLSNGNLVQCKIPIFSTMNQNFLPTLEEEFKSAQQNATFQVTTYPSKKISEEEANKILQSLQNQCAEYRTTAFLWQFCYKKYLRQFDDLYTIAEAQKNLYEDIYAGYYSFYKNTTNLTTFDHNQQENNQNYFEIQNNVYPLTFQYANKLYTYNSHITKSNLTDSTFVLISGHIIQLNGFNSSQISNNYSWAMKFSTSEEIPFDRLSESLQLISKQNPNSNSSQAKYHYEVALYTFIDKQFAFSKEQLPHDLDIEAFELIYYKTQEGVSRNSDFLSLFNGQYIYGKKLNALKHFSKNDLIIVHLYNQVVVKKIKKVWYHSLVELYEDKFGRDLVNKDHFIQSIQIFDRHRHYKLLEKGDIESQFIGKSNIYFDFTRFKRKERFISGRYLIGYNHLRGKVGDTLLFINRDSYIAANIRSTKGGIIELDTYLNEFNGFIIKANSNPNKQSYFDYYPSSSRKQISKYLINSSQYLNPTTPINMKNKQFPLILSFKSIKEETTSDSKLLPFTDLEGFSFNEDSLNKQRYFNFLIQTPLVREDFSQLKLVITDSLDEIKEGVEITFTFDNQILAYDIFNKKNIVSKNKRYENSTLSDTTVWILIDTDNSVRLGFSYMSPSNQVLQLQTNYTNLKHFRFLTKHTVNYFIKYPYLDVLENPIDFSVLNPNVELYRGQTITQQYYNGDWCGVINNRRSFEAEFICGESFFSLLSVTEPSTCKYKVQIETYLLCEKHLFTYNIPPPPKNIYCILQQENNSISK